MTLARFSVLIAAGTLSACVDAADTSGAAGTVTQGTALTTEAAFESAIVGRTVTFEGNSFQINADGSISGPWDGSGITGTWIWDGVYWCRIVTIGSGDPRPEDCQQWVINGNVATVTRDRGNGATFVYTIG